MKTKSGPNVSLPIHFWCFSTSYSIVLASYILVLNAVNPDACQNTKVFTKNSLFFCRIRVKTFSVSFFQNFVATGGGTFGGLVPLSITPVTDSYMAVWLKTCHLAKTAWQKRSKYNTYTHNYLHRWLGNAHTFSQFDFKSSQDLQFELTFLRLGEH